MRQQGQDHLTIVVQHAEIARAWMLRQNDDIDFPSLHIDLGAHVGVMIRPEYPAYPPAPTGPAHVRFSRDLAEAAQSYADEVERIHQAEQDIANDDDVSEADRAA